MENTRKLGRRWTPEEDAKLLELVEAGVNAKGIAWILGRASHRGVYDRLYLLRQQDRAVLTCGACRQSLPRTAFTPSRRVNGSYCVDCVRAYRSLRSA